MWGGNTNCRQSVCNNRVITVTYARLWEMIQTDRASWQLHTQDVLFLQAL